ncbi:MAG: acyl-CoA thioesterase [Acidimicrobiia bacterium]
MTSRDERSAGHVSRFDRDTACEPLGDGRYGCRIDRGWWIERGPNGGYVAATMLTSFIAEVADPMRAPRSLTVHYLAPPAEGPAEIVVSIDRQGRSLTYASARMYQGERLLVAAMCAFAASAPGVTFNDSQMPAVPVAGDLVDLVRPDGAPMVPMSERYQMRWAIGALPWEGSADRAVAGGWIRPVEARPLDHRLLAALCDAWVPPVFSRVEERLGVPTIDLTIHFLAPLPHPGMSDTDFVLSVFSSTVAGDGFIEEDGEIWSADGVLLAKCRQLALQLPLPG